ncbi:hypothetical protein [Burkholderia anthina]|uniref:hypothetical protein n=1 Tax=Burkholderia anthina TaxID=179879 RepID=UPI0037C0143B
MSERVPALDAAPTVDAPSHRTPPAVAAASVGFAPRQSTGAAIPERRPRPDPALIRCDTVRSMHRGRDVPVRRSCVSWHPAGTAHAVRIERSQRLPGPPIPPFLSVLDHERNR